MKRRNSVLVAVVLVVFCLSSFAQGNKEGAAGKKPVELLIFHQWPEMTDIMDAFCKQYNAAHPGVIVTTETSRAGNTIQIKYAAGDDPAIVGGVMTQQYMDLGKYNDLTKYTDLIKRCDPLCLQISTDIKSGKVYKLPMCNRSGGMWYDKALIKELGLKDAQTWDEFVANLRAIKKAYPNKIPLYMIGANQFHSFTFIAMGSKMAIDGAVAVQKAIDTGNNDLLKFDAPGGYLQVYAERILALRAEGLVDSELIINSTPEMSYEAFATHKFGYLCSGTFWYGGLKQAFPKAVDNVGMAPIPSIIDGVKPHVVVGVDSAISTSATKPYQEEINQLFLTLFSDKQLAIYSAGRGAPSAMSGITSEWGTKDMMANVNDCLAKYLPIVQMNPPSGFTMDDITALCQELFTNSLTPVKFAQQFSVRYNKAYTAASKK
jgi:raffinose/stachyose/melibiose transport system substrate-binding protein